MLTGEFGWYFSRNPLGTRAPQRISIVVYPSQMPHLKVAIG